jgi:hypothetical protein
MPKHRKHDTPDLTSSPNFDPSAARGALGQAFVRAITTDFERWGARRLRRLRRQRPTDYFRLVAALLPKEFRIREVELPDMTDEELAATLDKVRQLIAQDRRTQ